ncbi:MAG: aminoglycoside 6'-N-acetyltransferase [Bacilli bacterium]|jgi:aminoglycoside 6'-N-acetyltransferase I|nr:GNAT family N-acetyltransferase [Bacilli bacterium]MDD4063091.1 GNAT family N-acetyltransferase [Bacilli bacterium]MDD4481629.1 GNAT family N-acetyltransferase [Bacilli bacterium]MDY0363207.1 GNAT family N-acetyltransferase [Bacilli bacterium]
MICSATIKDIETISKMALKMWEDHTIEELLIEFENILKNKDSVVYIYYFKDNPVGFAHCQLRRDYVEGTHTPVVAYLEGIYIDKNNRRKGYAKDLLLMCEKWARQKGCIELASDCEIDNEVSFDFHQSVGFEEVNRIICFRKEI